MPYPSTLLTDAPGEWVKEAGHIQNSSIIARGLLHLHLLLPPASSSQGSLLRCTQRAALDGALLPGSLPAWFKRGCTP